MELDYVYVYKRKQAINDGVLIDVEASARTVGFITPVAVTVAVWETYIVPDKCMGEFETIEDRLQFLLSSLRLQITESPPQNYLLFTSWFRMPHKTLGDVMLEFQFKAIAGPGDNGEPVITVMLPYED